MNINFSPSYTIDTFTIKSLAKIFSVSVLMKNSVI